MELLIFAAVWFFCGLLGWMLFAYQAQFILNLIKEQPEEVRESHEDEIRNLVDRASYTRIMMIFAGLLILVLNSLFIMFSLPSKQRRWGLRFKLPVY